MKAPTTAAGAQGTLGVCQELATVKRNPDELLTGCEVWSGAAGSLHAWGCACKVEPVDCCRQHVRHVQGVPSTNTTTSCSGQVCEGGHWRDALSNRR